MAPKDSKDAHHHRFFSLRGKKKEPRIKKGLGEALGAIGLRPDEDGKCASGDCVRSTEIHPHFTYVPGPSQTLPTAPRNPQRPKNPKSKDPIRSSCPSHAFSRPHIISA